MAGSCETCGRGLSFSQRARGRKTCDSCAAEAQAALAKAGSERQLALARAISEYDAALTAASQAGLSAGPAVDQLRTVERAIVASGGDIQARKGQFYRSFLDRALADEQLTLVEEQQLDAVASALFPADQEGAQLAILRDYQRQIFIAMVNGGRLPQVSEPQMMPRKGEVVHLQVPAALLKEVIQREFQGGSRGMSFRVMKGVSYRVGSFRGRSVEIGRSIEVVDSGTLFVTSHRAVYTGQRKSVEVPYPKMLDLNVYTDAVQFHVSGRQNPSMLRVGDGPMVAAVINAASQRLL
jgi:hypothetical protein